MPTPTWDGLDPAKRERILDAAAREFGARGFSSGSLNVIARAAGIAKGSLFVYFSDKFELFGYVCDRTSQRVREHMLARMVAAGLEQDLFDLLRITVVDWVDYFRDHPVERGVTLATNFEMDPDVRREVRGVVNRHYLEVLRPLVAAAAARGEVVGSTERLLASLLLLLPHLAVAPFQPEVDPVLRMDQLDRAGVAALARGLIDDLERAYGP